MKDPKQFLDELELECEPLFQRQEQMVVDHFASNPSAEELAEYFKRRMINERINCIQFSRAIAEAPKNTSPEDLFLLTKQAHDEAKHFWFVKDIVEDLLGHEVDVEDTDRWLREQQLSGKHNDIRPAKLLEKYEGSKDPMVMAVYQVIAEGMAARNWAMTAAVATKEKIREKYAEIAKDEKFHASLGRRSLEKLLVDSESQQRAKELADEFLGVLNHQTCIRQHIPLSELEEFV